MDDLFIRPHFAEHFLRILEINEDYYTNCDEDEEWNYLCQIANKIEEIKTYRKQDGAYIAQSWDERDTLNHSH